MIKYGTWTFYPSPVEIHDVVTFVEFADACHIKDFRQVCYISGVAHGAVEKEITFHIISYASHCSYLPAKSTPAAKSFAPYKGINERVMRVFNIIFELDTRTTVTVNSKDL